MEGTAALGPGIPRGQGISGALGCSCPGPEALPRQLEPRGLVPYPLNTGEVVQ